MHINRIVELSQMARRELGLPSILDKVSNKDIGAICHITSRPEAE